MGGILDTILRRLADYIEKAEKLKKRIKGAMTYPLVVVAIAIIVIAVILIFVIPVFEDMFAGFGAALPAPTQLVVNMSRFMKGNFHFIIIALIAIVIGIKQYRNSRNLSIELSKNEAAHLWGAAQKSGCCKIYTNPWYDDPKRCAHIGFP